MQKKMQKANKKQIIQKLYKRTISKSIKHAIMQPCNYVRQKKIHKSKIYAKYGAMQKIQRNAKSAK